jgi:hypothetical protein
LRLATERPSSTGTVFVFGGEQDSLLRSMMGSNRTPIDLKPGDHLMNMMFLECIFSLTYRSLSVPSFHIVQVQLVLPIGLVLHCRL